MRIFALAALLFPALVVGQDITRQGWLAGNATLGGCTNKNVSDTNTLTVGKCYPISATQSIFVNDCWNNGVGSLTHYNGSAQCDSAFASGYIVTPSTYNNQAYCTVDTNPVAYNTFTCNSATAATNQIIMINAYFLQPQCSGATPQPFNATVGVCTQLIQGFYALGNCANGLVTASLYTDPNCNVQFYPNNTIATLVATVGPTAQLGAASAQGKQDGQPGSTCAVVPGKAALSFTCYTPPTPAPTNPSSSSSSSTGGGGNATPSPTPAPGSSGQGGSASHITFGVAALVVPLLAALL